MKYLIEGGKKLSGTVRISGSKHAVLPILAATIITGKKTTLHNCPDISDVHCTIDILRYLGYSVTMDGSTIIVDSSKDGNPEVPPELMTRLRSSIIFLGAFIHRFGYAKLSRPGGCELGKRPIDIHLSMLSQMGAEIEETDNRIYCQTSGLHGGEYRFSFPSVGATENIMIASLKADGPVVLKNAAKEPEVADLANFLNTAGAKILGAGTDTIRITPIDSFSDCDYTVCSDRIEAATYMAIGAATASTLTLTNAPCKDLKRMSEALEQMGVYVIEKLPDTVTVIPPKRLKPVNMITTLPHPGFPTDAQALLMASLLKAQGSSMIVENIFENRYNHVEELKKLGASIRVKGNTAKIDGVSALHGACVTAGDLRAGAALVIAALSAEGKTLIENVHHIERGYENMIEKLRLIGAKAEIITDIPEQNEACESQTITTENILPLTQPT